jgi:hypothetical protein
MQDFRFFATKHQKNSATQLMVKNIEELNLLIQECKQNALIDSSDISDGFHSFKELYTFRMMYNAALFNEWHAQGKYEVHKSLRHHDGELCFGGGWFVVAAMLPTGQITNHYPLDSWEQFAIPAVERALFAFDGHSPLDVLERFAALR